MPLMPFGWCVGWARGWFSSSGCGDPQWELANFAGERNQTVQCNIERENVALWCGCGIPPAEWLDSSAVGIVQLEHAAGESILCSEGWQRSCYQITLGFLVSVTTLASFHMIEYHKQFFIFVQIWQVTSVVCHRRPKRKLTKNELSVKTNKLIKSKYKNILQHSCYNR